jgi:nicotinate-nucleotide adenylyltransferase
MPANKKTGLFFGSFNPIHLGHMIIAGYMLEFTEMDEIWFIISPHNPLKQKKSLLDDHHRYYMVNLALEGHYNMKASNIEFGMTRPSYTIHTLTYLQEKYPHRDFILIAGSDILPTFHKWKNYGMILQDYQLYVYPRPFTADHPYKKHPSLTFVDAPLIEISSSFIREAIKEEKDVSFLLPPGIYEYITEMHFYEH